MYQEALTLLGQSGLPFENRATPPFSVALGLSGALGKDARSDVEASSRWFVDQVEYSEFMGAQSAELLVKLGLAPAMKKRASTVEFNYSERLPELLSLAANAIDERTGMFSK